MFNFILRVIQRAGLWIGLLFIISAFMIGGMKTYEHLTYLPTQATVLGLSTKCDMSYSRGRYSKFETTVECSDVESTKASYPNDINWKVRQVVFVHVGYATPSGQPMQTEVRLGKLGQSGAKIGQQVHVLQSPTDPKVITGPANAAMMAMVVMFFCVGAGLFAASRWAKLMRNRGPQSKATVRSATATDGQFAILPGASPAETGTADQMIQSWKTKQPTVSPPRR